MLAFASPSAAAAAFSESRADAGSIATASPFGAERAFSGIVVELDDLVPHTGFDQRGNARCGGAGHARLLRGPCTRAG